MKTVRVVAAVICDSILDTKKIFATARGYGEFKGLWEFPGGKIEEGETPQQAIKREIKEELAAEIAVYDLIGTIEHDYPTFHLTMECYACEVTAGDLVLKEAEASQWLTKDELDSVQWLPADLKIMDKIREGLFMNKEALYESISKRYEELQQALKGTDLKKIKELTLEVHAMVHPAEISGRSEKTIADYVLDFMLSGNQNALVPRENYDTDLHYAGTNRVPMCWQFWHTYRIEDLVSNILMMNQDQIFNSEWQKKIGASITDTGNALEFDEAVEFGKGINVEALREYMVTVGKNTRRIIETLTLEQIQSMVPEKWVMRILEVGGVTTDFRSVWLLVFWGRLTRGGMILTPLTNHHMMHLPACLNNLPIMQNQTQ